MPFINLKIAGRRLSPIEVRELQHDLTQQMGSVLGKKTALTAVLIELLDVSGWSIGARGIDVAAHLEVSITEGTNTPAEKMDFIAEAHALLRARLGQNLPLETYVVLKEIPADAWGYGGLTQDFRRQTTMRPASATT